MFFFFRCGMIFMDGENMNIEDVIVEKEISVVFMGTPEFSVPVLEGLINNYHVKAVVTQPDKLVGRKGLLTQPPIKKKAIEHNILVLQPKKIQEEYQEIIDLHPDIIVTCAYGQIIPKPLLDYPKYGCINVHASLLPKLRGGAPIHRAIINGYDKTGITIMYMDEAMDSGDIISRESIAILDDDTASSLHNKLSVLGRDLLLKTMPSILNGTNDRIKQNDSEVTYAFNIKPDDEKLDFSKTKREIYNQIRGLYSFPGAYCNFEGKRLKIWASIIGDNIYSDKLDGEICSVNKEGISVKTGNGEIIITELQLEGKNRMKAKDFANGKDLVGKILS